MNFDNIWVEKYRPKTLDDIVLPAETRRVIESYQSKKEISNLLLTSSPGQGKTTLAKIIVNNILECDYLYINASDENGIDTIRTKVISFAQTRSLNGDIKVVILDESDGISPEGQRALRNVMEEYAANTRFVLTANYKHKIIPAVQSRCISLNFNHNIQDVLKHCFGILKKEGIQVDEDQKPLFVDLVKQNFPDFRKIINELQKNSTSGKLQIVNQTAQNDFVKEIIEKINDPFDCRRYYIQNECAFQSDYHNLLKSLVQYIYNINAIKNKRELILIITEYMYRHAFVVDQEINFFACILQINKILNS
jgi:DNA polymerase III delta prime subunit